VDVYWDQYIWNVSTSKGGDTNDVDAGAAAIGGENTAAVTYVEVTCPEWPIWARGKAKAQVGGYVQYEWDPWWLPSELLGFEVDVSGSTECDAQAIIIIPLVESVSAKSSGGIEGGTNQAEVAARARASGFHFYDYDSDGPEYIYYYDYADASAGFLDVWVEARAYAYVYNAGNSGNASAISNVNSDIYEYWW